MGVLALTYEPDDKYIEICEYLDEHGEFWVRNDIWSGEDNAFAENGITIQKKVRKCTIADFTSFRQEQIKNEMKYFVLKQLKDNSLTACGYTANYLRAMQNLGKAVSFSSITSLAEAEADELQVADENLSNTEIRIFRQLKGHVISFIKDYYDSREGLDRDKWYALQIPGVKLSAALKRQRPSMSFAEIPVYYRDSVKRYMKNLIYRRSWSFCRQLLYYIVYFYKTFYEHGYRDGFQENLTRADIEKYLQWVSEDYENNNATFRSKAVSFIRNWLDFIQLAEFEMAPKKDLTRLIFEDDIPKRERSADTYEKIKYIPEPVRNELDAAIGDLEPAEMKPVYILLRETGWRGTDILNLRYDQCLDYVWNSRDEEYVPYLYDEITKTGIPLHKIPIRPEVAEMVAGLIKEAKEKSTEENNPDRYLFNTYEGKCKGLPYSKPAFAAAVNELIGRKGIRDESGELYHFKTHSLRHTRAMEYTEQGMPIGIIQQILGHCSLQMTLHYAKVSEDLLYKKWKEIEKLNLFKPNAVPPNKKYPHTEEVCYERVRKNLDAVRVPFGTCFKPSKMECKNQTRMCLECASFCSTKEDLPLYDAEISRVNALISIAEKTERTDWTEKNKQYLNTLHSMKGRILQEGTVHKNGRLREDCSDR